MYKVRYSCLSVQGIWGMPRESGENCTDPEEDRYLGQVLPHTGKNQPHPLPPKLHYHVIIHFEIHVYLHFPVSLYIQSPNFIDCNGTMVVLFIRDVVCVRGDWGLVHCFKTVILMSFSCWVLIYLTSISGPGGDGCWAVSCTWVRRCIVHIESAVKQSLRASSWFSWYRTPYKFNLSHSVPKSNQLRWLSLVQSIWTKALGEFRTPVYLQFTSLLS